EHTNQKIKTINFVKTNKTEVFEFYQHEEATTQITYTKVAEKYLYEPNASVMKSGAFKLVASRFELHKLHKNTHLYTSNELQPDFPGRIFEIKKQWRNSKKELKELTDQIPKANISTRNYPVSVDELHKKLKIKNGGEVYLFGCTLTNEEKTILECRKL
ncbi:MAG TPA: SAM-dependent methyltransferase, partial [Paludibacter sp.]